MALLKDLRQPFNLVMLLLAIGAIGIALYAYYYPRTDKRISYLVSPATKIFDSKSATPKIRLLDGSNNPITTDTYVNTVTLWNSGSQSIEPGEVRKPLRILVTADRLLDFSIAKEKDKSVSGFALASAEGASPRSQAVDVRWTHFDPRHGLTLQIIYSTSDPKPRVWPETEIAGLESLKDARALGERYSWLRIVTVILFMFVFGMAWGFSSAVTQNRSVFARITFRVILFGVLIGLYWLSLRTLFVSDSAPF
jgi:hypothetical protein